MGKLSRQKGAAYEREIANLFQAYGFPARRNVQETQLGNDCDVLVEHLALAVQCKVGARPPVFDALKEAEEVGRVKNQMPVAFIRKNAERPFAPCEDVVVLRTTDFMRLLAAYITPDDHVNPLEYRDG